MKWRRKHASQDTKRCVRYRMLHGVKDRVKKRALSAAQVKPSQNVFTVHELRHVICDIWSVTLLGGSWKGQITKLCLYLFKLESRVLIGHLPCGLT